MNSFHVKRIAIPILTLLGLTAGCSQSSNQKPVYPVNGHVTFEGKPVTRATILFASVDGGDRALQPNATTDEQGNYTLTSYKSNDGAPEGEFIVSIFWPGPRSKKSSSPSPDPEEESEKNLLGPDRLKGRYYPLLKSPLRATVKQGQNNVLDFALP